MASGVITVLVMLIYIFKLVVGNTVFIFLWVIETLSGTFSTQYPFTLGHMWGLLRSLFGVSTLDIGGTFEIEPQPKPKQI